MGENRLASFIEGIVNSKDIAAAEVGHFVVQLSAHRSSTPYWDFLALLGTALRSPETFAQQPLTHCPPGMSVELQESNFQFGDQTLRTRAAAVRSSLIRAGFSPQKQRLPADDPQGFCQAVIQPLDLPRNVSKDYQLAVGLILLLITSDFTNELGPTFGRLPMPSLASCCTSALSSSASAPPKSLQSA